MLKILISRLSFLTSVVNFFCYLMNSHLQNIYQKLFNGCFIYIYEQVWIMILTLSVCVWIKNLAKEKKNKRRELMDQTILIESFSFTLLFSS